MPTNAVVDWITDANTFFLIGTGCSKCADKPLMPELTEKVSKDLTPNGAKLLADLAGNNGRPATVEDLITHLQYLDKILISRKTKSGDWTIDSTGKEIELIQKSILKHIGFSWVTSNIHKQFIKRICLQSSRRVCDIFTLNYDTVIEATLEGCKIQYIDGFSGAENAHFDEALFDDCKSVAFRLFKLHGSLNWTRENDGTVRRRPGSALESAERLVIYPAEQKYFITQYGVYELLINRFRARMREVRPNNKLVVLGYSFCDDHINEAIVDALRLPGNNLTVYAFIGPETDTTVQENRIGKLFENSKDRFNAVIGDRFIGEALSVTEWDLLKALNIWKFESLVNMIAGGIK